MPKIVDLKSTLNLPRTSFPMKAGLPQHEPAMLAKWDRDGLYRRIQQARAGAATYILHDGPPYPTGTIHLGTALNKILKDMVVKSKTMAGFRAPYVPGWDCHGLPIETQVEKELGGKKGSIPPVEFRRMCREFALRYVDQHRRDFKRLGVLGRWDDPYLTMSNAYEATIAGAFVTFLERGYISRGLKPVYWCIHDRTALAEAEVEYEDHTSPSIWVKFPVVAGEASAKLEAGADNAAGVDALIWTTTPWTLPHNRALAFHPDFEYVVAETPAGNLLVAAERLAALPEHLGAAQAHVRGPWKGRELAGLKFHHPFLELRVPAVLADYVTLDQGTGIVHTAPGHGADDFQTGQKYGLETYAPIDDQGRYTEGLPEYKSKTVFEANPVVIALLRDRGMLAHESKLMHSYPHCWRCHNPVIFRATEQWFINLDEPGHDSSGQQTGALRPRALAAIDDVNWTPQWGRERIYSMIETRPDWCISRQRVWGVPLVIFYCDRCGQILEDFAALRHVVGWFEREGADAWYEHSSDELLPPGTRCTCGGTHWRKETDILDVWFDSGSSHLAVLDPPETPAADLPWPADMYLEGPDQYRGWFHSSLLIGVAVRGGAPYRQVLTHGWTLDERGRPMSKSLGNTVLPTEICEKWGADLLRLWVASQDYQSDVRMSDNVMTQLSEAYRKVRNTFRFAISNLFDFDPARDAMPESELEEIDRFMLQRTSRLVSEAEAFYQAFDFHRVYHALHDFCVVELSAFYFDILKDRLYTFAPRGPARRSAQTAVYRIATALVRLLAPILAFTAEEIWQYLPRTASEPDSVHLALFPKPMECRAFPDEALDARWEHLREVRTETLKALEQARAEKRISSALEARVVLGAEGTLAELLEQYAAWLPALFIVSQVQFASTAVDAISGSALRSATLPGLTIAVVRASGTKCERCWNYSTRVGENLDYPTICERCVAALREIEASDAVSAGSGPAVATPPAGDGANA